MIEKKDKVAILSTQLERLTEEQGTIDTDKEASEKAIEKLKAQNVELEKQILITLQKIEINTLLKEVDIEDLRQQAKTNAMVNKNLQSMIERWQKFEDQEKME